ncbi:MAG: beta-ketoacyl-ACP synthase III [bacterium]
MKGKSAGIAGVGSYAPSRKLTNSDLEKIVDTSDEWIRTRTGISERRICEDGVPTSEIAVIAARRAIAQAGISPEEIDLVICATVTPDMPFPAMACIVQDKIGATRAAAFDLEAGCSGFMYALAVGTQFIESGVYENVLICGADSLTRITDWTDRNTCVLFGDGGGAVLLRPAEEGYGVLSFQLGADGSGGDLLKMPAGGSLMPASRETVDKKLHTIKMAGNEVFKFAVKVMGDAAVKALEKAHIRTDEVKCFIPHQANMRIIEAAARRLGVGMDRFFVNLNKYGNTSCGSIPLALSEALEVGRIRKGDIVVMVGFGAGLTWAANVVRWSY